jgi:hypothetical protein
MRRCYLPYDLKLYNTHKLWRFVVATRCLKLFRYKDRIHVSVFDTKSSKLMCRRLRPIPITELSKNICSPNATHGHLSSKLKSHMVLIKKSITWYYDLKNVQAWYVVWWICSSRPVAGLLHLSWWSGDHVTIRVRRDGIRGRSKHEVELEERGRCPRGCIG